MKKENKRDLFISLVFSGNSPDVAYLHNPKYSISDYEKTLSLEEYKEFAEKINRQFLDNIDLRLMGNLYRAEQALSELGVDEKNYPQILKAYTDLLKITAPIVERLQKIKVEQNTFEGLELCIKGTND